MKPVERGLILDEIQRAPELLSYIQVLVDEHDEPGRFILTGSQNLLPMESVSQTLAGRTALLRLHPLSLAELYERPPLDPLNLDGAAGPPAEAVGRPPPQDLAPHHQYVATYSWLRAPEPVGFGAHAVVHLGTHGTLEWLDGKDVGLSEADAPDALIGDLPDLYVYNVDVVGEGLVARRRGMATLVDHMAPPFVKSGLLPELAALSESVDDYHGNVHKNEQLAEAYADEILESQIFHLLGTRPVWDARGKVIEVEVVPAHEFGRPRVDIVIASAAEGMFNNVTRLMDEAVQRVKVIEEAENYVRRHYLATRAALVDRGYSEVRGRGRAAARAAGLGDRRGRLDPPLGRRPARGAARGVAVAPPRVGTRAAERRCAGSRQDPAGAFSSRTRLAGEAGRPAPGSYRRAAPAPRPGAFCMDGSNDRFRQHVYQGCPHGGVAPSVDRSIFGCGSRRAVVYG